MNRKVYLVAEVIRGTYIEPDLKEVVCNKSTAGVDRCLNGSSARAHARARAGRFHGG